MIFKAVVSTILMFCLGAAQAGEPTYAIMSLAGDTLTLVAQRHQVGSRTEAQPKQETALEDQVFDQVAVLAARAALLKARPAAKVVPMMTQDKGLYRAQNAMFEQPQAHQADRDYLKSLLAEQGATHLLLVSRHSAKAAFEMYNSVESGAQLEGLGFYIDDVTVTRNMQTSATARGMLIPFAYLKVRLVDAQTMQVLGESVAKQSRIFVRPSNEGSGMATFASMTLEEKTDQIRGATRRAVDEALPPLLGL